jgi:hypothetical protein
MLPVLESALLTWNYLAHRPDQFQPVSLFLLKADDDRWDQRLDLLRLKTVFCHAVHLESRQGAALDQVPGVVRGDAEDAGGLGQ